MVGACMVAHAELNDIHEEAAQWAAEVAELQQAIREYDCMYYIVYDEEFGHLQWLLMEMTEK